MCSRATRSRCCKWNTALTSSGSVGLRDPTPECHTGSRGEQMNRVLPRELGHEQTLCIRFTVAPRL